MRQNEEKVVRLVERFQSAVAGDGFEGFFHAGAGDDALNFESAEEARSALAEGGAAQILRLPVSTLRSRMRRLGLT